MYFLDNPMVRCNTLACNLLMHKTKNSAMHKLLIIEFALGLALGARFNVFILFPATLLSAVIGVFAAVRGPLPIFLSVILFICLIQAGFLLGVVARGLLAQPPAPRTEPRKTTQAAKSQPRTSLK
jgi:hypothetical protein